MTALRVAVAELGRRLAHVPARLAELPLRLGREDRRLLHELASFSWSPCARFSSSPCRCESSPSRCCASGGEHRARVGEHLRERVADLARLRHRLVHRARAPRATLAPARAVSPQRSLRERDVLLEVAREPLHRRRGALRGLAAPRRARASRARARGRRATRFACSYSTSARYVTPGCASSTSRARLPGELLEPLHLRLRRPSAARRCFLRYSARIFSVSAGGRAPARPGPSRAAP